MSDTRVTVQHVIDFNRQVETGEIAIPKGMTREEVLRVAEASELHTLSDDDLHWIDGLKDAAAKCDFVGWWLELSKDPVRLSQLAGVANAISILRKEDNGNGRR